MKTVKISLLAVAFLGLSVNAIAQEYCDIQKFKIIKTDYGDAKGAPYHRIGELNGAVLNADTLSFFAPDFHWINISNETFASDVTYDIIAVLYFYADTVLLVKDTFGAVPIPIGRTFSPNDTVNLVGFFSFLSVTNYLKEEHGLDLEQISRWEMISGIRYTSKDGYYSDSVFYAGADTVAFRVVRGNVGIAETENYPSLRVYPNPARNGELRVENGELKENSVIEIYNVVGQKLQSTTVNLQSTITIDISHLTNGMYFLKIDGKVARFVKE